MQRIDQPIRYKPSIRRGTLVLSGLVAVCILVAIGAFIASATTSINWLFGIYLALGIAACLPLPMLGYRLYALQTAFYEIDRSSLKVHWGLRTEQIPFTEIQWVRPADDLTAPLPKPRLALPGAYLGILQIDGLGKVEFLADGVEHMLLAAAAETVFVISPEDPRKFLASYHRSIELGSLVHMERQSLLPSFILGKIFDNSLARGLIFTNLIMVVFILVWGVLLFTTVGAIPFGQPPVPTPSIRAILFPVVGGFVFLIDLIAGSFFFRNETQRNASYLLWGSGVLTSFLILVSMLIITVNL